MFFAADTKPIIFGCTGPVLDAEEKSFFKNARPLGFILFQKNCVDPGQVKKLCDDLRDCVDWEAPILIDQEGGRVQRLKPPHWRDFPAMRGFGAVYRQNKNAALAGVENNYTALAKAQVPMGIDVNCVPVLDVVPADSQTKAIGDRAFDSDPQIVADLGLAAVDAAIAAGMTPVMKHMPGHGRASVDSHHDLPRVTADRATLEAGWMPFRAVAMGVKRKDSLWGMTAHVIYESIDPQLPATLSPTIIRDVIRGAIGFEGLLVTDDLFMDALAPFGDVPDRARKALDAGCDIALHCHGSVADRMRAANTVSLMRADTRARLEAWKG